MANILDLTRTGVIESQNGDTVYSAAEEGQLFNTIVTRNFVSECEFADIPDEVQKLVDMLEPGGDLHLIEPSAEWAAREILKGNVDVVRTVHLFGDKDNPRRSYCLLTMLRDLLSRMGLVHIRAGTSPYIIAKDDMDREYKGDQHYVIGMKPNPEVPDKSWVR